jgi:hypothetical protein
MTINLGKPQALIKDKPAPLESTGTKIRNRLEYTAKPPLKRVDRNDRR